MLIVYQWDPPAECLESLSFTAKNISFRLGRSSGSRKIPISKPAAKKKAIINNINAVFPHHKDIST